MLSFHQASNQQTNTNFDLKINNALPYKGDIWQQQAAFDHITKSGKLFSWEKSLRNLSINDITPLLNKTVKNVISNYISPEIITIAKKVILEIYEMH